MMTWITEHWQSIIDWLVRTGFTSGVIWNSWKYARDRKARQARLTTEQVKAELEGRTVENKITTSSITTIEAGQAAMLHAFEQERQAKDRTIAHLEVQITERDHIIEVSQAKITELQHELEALRVRTLQATSDLMEQITHLSEQLKALQGPIV